jgi:CheY-like chemotaxis protein
MSGDLLTLRMIVVSADNAAREQWGAGAATATVPIEYSAADAAADAVRRIKRGCDILLLDAALTVEDRDALLAAAKALPSRPLIAMAAPRGTTRLDGVNVMVPNPESMHEARALVERCIRMRLPKRLLIVDDSKTMRSIVRKILSASRFLLDVAEAEEGIAALKKLSDGYDVVLLDYNMPGFNGIQTLSQIKQISPGVEVIIMTSTEDEALAGRAQASGAAAFLKKPFYPADIDAVLARIYETPGRS